MSVLTKEALQRTRLAGKKYTRSAPYGSRWENGLRVQDRFETRICARIIVMRLDLEMNYSEIARMLDEHEIPTRTGRPWNYSSIRCIWKRSVSRLITNLLKAQDVYRTD